MDVLLDSAEQSRVLARHANQLQRLKSSTHFTYEELASLLMIFHKMTRDGRLDRKKFRGLMYSMYGLSHWVLIDRLFVQFEIDRCGYIIFETFATNMSIFLRGTLEEKARFTFATYDVNGAGFIRRENMIKLLRMSILSADDGEELVKELSEVLVKKLDKDHDGKVSVEDFLESVRLNPNLVESLGPCLPARKAAHAFMCTFAQNPGLY